MKIGIYWYSDQWGGADTHLSHLLLNWPNVEDELVIYYNHNNSGYQRVYSRCSHLKNVTFKRFRSYSYTYLTDYLRKSRFFIPLRAILYFMAPLFYFIQYAQCLHILKNEHLDYLISDNGGYPASWNCLAVLQAGAALKIRSRDLLIHHGSVPPAKFRAWFDSWLDRQVGKYATRIIAVSRATYDTLLQFRHEVLARVPHEIIYNGVDIKTISSRDKKNFPYQKPDGARWLAVIGRLEAYKGHEDIVDAVSLLSEEEKKKVGIIFIGSGAVNFVSQLKKKISSFHLERQFIFTGYIHESPEELIPFFDGILVATRDFEGFGLSLAEGMAQGKPVIATRVGAIPEFVRSPDVGILVEPLNPQDLSDAIRDFISKPEIWNIKGLKAYEQIQKYSASNMGKFFYNLTRS